MNTLEAITGRRSIRKFKPEKVDRETIEKIVAAAAYAPSWKNTQVTRYHVFDDQTIKDTIANNYTLGFAYNVGTISHAPQVVAITAVKGRSGVEKDGSYTTNKGDAWLMFDAGAATQTFCLAAYEYGVGSVIMGIFDAEKVAQLLRIPENEVVVALVPIGYPDESPDAPRRKSVADLLSFVNDQRG